MFFLSLGERGPRVVLVQTLLRLKGINVRITGKYDEECSKGVKQYRERLNMHPLGSVDANVFFHLLQNSKLKIIDSIDGSAGDLQELVVKEMKRAGINPLINQRLVGRGVANAVDKIVERAENHRIGLLRITGHGNRGNWISVAIGDPVGALKEGRMNDYEEMKKDWKSYIDYSHFERHRSTLSKITSLFASFGSAEIHSCSIGKQEKLIQKLADTWGVPVTAGKGLQYGATTLQNRQGERTSSTFVMEGELFTAYPKGQTLESWAAGIESSVPNLMALFARFKQQVTGK
jgi:hypothetical protein